MNNPSFPAADVRTLFGKSLPVTATEGLRYAGGSQGAVIMPESSLPSVTDPVFAEAGGGGEGHNWKPRKVDDTHLTISSGDAAGAVATIGGVSLDDVTPPQLEVSATDLVYVYLCVVYSLSLSADGVVETSSAVTSREITAETGEQTNTDTERWFLLFKWQAGRVVEQKRFYSIGIRVGDNGGGTSTPIYETWIAG